MCTYVWLVRHLLPNFKKYFRSILSVIRAGTRWLAQNFCHHCRLSLGVPARIRTSTNHCGASGGLFWVIGWGLCYHGWNQKWIRNVNMIYDGNSKGGGAQIYDPFQLCPSCPTVGRVKILKDINPFFSWDSLGEYLNGLLCIVPKVWQGVYCLNHESNGNVFVKVTKARDWFSDCSWMAEIYCWFSRFHPGLCAGHWGYAKFKMKHATIPGFDSLSKPTWIANILVNFLLTNLDEFWIGRRFMLGRNSKCVVIASWTIFGNQIGQKWRRSFDQCDPCKQAIDPSARISSSEIECSVYETD